MNRTTRIKVIFFVLCWTANFGVFAYFMWEELVWWKLTLVGCFLAAIFASVFVPTNRYRP